MTPDGLLPLLTAMCVPAVLINACGLFVLSTAQRLSRQLDRVRALARLPEPARSGSAALIRLTGRRARLLHRSLAAQYVAVCLFVAAMVGIAAVRASGPAWVPVVLALGGVLALLVSCVLLLIESREAYAAIRSELTSLQ